MPSQKEIHLPTIHVQGLVLGRVPQKIFHDRWPSPWTSRIFSEVPMNAFRNDLTQNRGDNFCQDGWDLKVGEIPLNQLPFRGWETQPICSKISEPQGSVRETNHNFLSCHHLPEQCRKIPSYPHGITWPYPREGKLGNSSTQRNRRKSWDMLVLMEDFHPFSRPRFSRKSYQILVHTT